MAKLMIQANKVKHVLSANTDIPVFIDALHDDINYQTHISRAKFEEICHDLLVRAAEPIEKALKMANVTLDELDAVELIGGAMRVPKVQEAVSHALGDGKLELGMHLNSDESMALGAAFHGANVSTSFKVRHVGLADVNPFPIAVDLTDLAVGKEEKKGGGGLFGVGKKKDDKKKEGGDDEWAKHATIFKLGSKLAVKKTIAFSYDKDVHVEVNYEESDNLPIGTGLSIEQYDVSGIADFAKEMADKKLGTPKVSLQFELDSSGITKLIKAEAVVEETVMVDEEVEVDDDEGTEEKKDEEKTDEEKKDDTPAETESEKKEGDADADADAEADDKEDKKEEKKEEKKKKKTITVQKEKKKKHVRALKVDSYHVGTIRPYSPEIMEESKAKLNALAQKDKERMMLEEAKNKYESYIYFIRNKLVDDEEDVNKVTSEEQREALRKSAEDAEEWMFDEGFSADLKTYEAKYEELSAPAEKAFFRVAELSARPKAIKALTSKLDKVEELMKKWETTMTHITEEERKEVLDKVADVRKWVEEKVKEQEKADKTADPVFTSEEVPGQTKKIESIVGKLMKKPKPKPEKKNETDGDKNETNSEGESAESEDLDAKDADGAGAEADADEKTEEAVESDEKKDGDEL
jgi:hypoxia up-regulated 1